MYETTSKFFLFAGFLVLFNLTNICLQSSLSLQNSIYLVYDGTYLLTFIFQKLHTAFLDIASAHRVNVQLALAPHVSFFLAIKTMWPNFRVIGPLQSSRKKSKLFQYFCNADYNFLLWIILEFELNRFYISSGAKCYIIQYRNRIFIHIIIFQVQVFSCPHHDIPSTLKHNVGQGLSVSY